MFFNIRSIFHIFLIRNTKQLSPSLGCCILIRVSIISKMSANYISVKQLICSLVCLSAFACGAQERKLRLDGENVGSYQSLFAGYNLYSLRPVDAASFTLSGFDIGYNIDFKVSKTLPLYVGTGLESRFAFRVKTFHDTPTNNPIDVKTTTRFINLNVPINISYRVDASPTTAIIPQFGFDFRVQLSARTKVDVAVPDGSPSMSKAAIGYTPGTYNLLSRKQMGDEVMRRCQVGWHAGLKLQHESFVVGISYGTDFSRLRNELGASNLLINLGYVF